MGSRSALPLARYAPDDIADIVRHQKRTIGTECDADWSSIGLPLIGREESRQNIPRGTRRAAILERHEHDLVAAQRRAIPGTVLPDCHAVRKARQRASRQPAQA